MDLPEKVLLLHEEEEASFIFKIALNECSQDIELVCENSTSSVFARMANDDISIPDILILSWCIPKINSKEVLVRIQKHPCYTYQSLFLPTFLDQVHLDEAKELGATFFLRNW